MGSRSETAPGEDPSRRRVETESGAASGRPSPATVLLLAAWIGLVAGFLDLGLFVLRRRLIDGEFYRLGDGFPWIIPAGVAAMVMLPGAALALVARLRRGAVPLGIAVGLPAFVGFLDLRRACFPWSSGRRCCSPRGSRSSPPGSSALAGAAFLRLVRLTAPLLAGAVLVLALATSGARAWSEHRAIAALPPPPPGARNVLLIVWDTVRARNLSLHGYGRPTTPHLERLAARGVAVRARVRDVPLDPAVAREPVHRAMAPRALGRLEDAAGRRPTPRSPERLGALGYDTAGFVANLDYCGRETGIARGFAHYEDYPLGVWEVFTRYVGLGRKVDQHLLSRWWRTSSRGGAGAGHAPCSRSRRSTPRGPRTSTGASWTGSPGSARGAARSSPS